MSFYTNPVAAGQTIRTSSTQTSSFTAAANTNYFVSASGGAVTVTLPTSAAGQLLLVKKTDSSTNAVTLSGTINGVGSSTYSITKQNQTKELYNDGSTGWNIISGDLDITTVGASSSSPGFVQLTGDLGGTSSSPTVPALTTKITGSGTATMTVGVTAPSSPSVGDLWIDTN